MRKSLCSSRQSDDQASPMQSIKRRLSIGIANTISSDADVEYPEQNKSLTKSSKKCSNLRRSHSTICDEKFFQNIDDGERKMALLSRRSISEIAGPDSTTTSEKKSKQSGSGKYLAKAKTLSGIVQLSNRKESMHNLLLRSSLPVTGPKQRRDGNDNKTAVAQSPTFAFARSDNIEKKGDETRLHSLPTISFCREPNIASSSSCDYVSVSPTMTSTRYDALDDNDLTIEDSIADSTVDFDHTNEFLSFCDTDVSMSEVRTPSTDALKGKGLSLDVGGVLLQRQGIETEKASSKWRRIARGQMRKWSQRRNTIESEEAARRSQNMLRVSSSGRISLRQKNQNNADNRLSLFGNTAESLLTLMQQPEMLQAFRAFLKKEYSEENLDFWLECEQYRSLKPQRRRKVAARIYATYLDVKAPKEINIDAGTRARTECNLENPNENTFDEAQRHIFDLMERDSFRRFITSDKSL